MAPSRKHILFLSLLAFSCSQSVAWTAEEPLTVFVFAGQSNMVGKRSKAAELPEPYRGQQSNVLVFDGQQWAPYRAGLGQKAGFGPEVAAAWELTKVLGQPVGIVKHSVGGTNLAIQWNPQREKNLYAALKAKVALAGKKRPIKVAGAFWMQGGADAKSESRAAAYADNLDLLIAAMRRDFDNPSLPFVAGRSGRGPKSSNPRYPAMGKVRAGQEKSRPNYAWVDCDKITVGPDKIHYDTRGIVELGRKMATAMRELLKAEGK